VLLIRLWHTNAQGAGDAPTLTDEVVRRCTERPAPSRIAAAGWALSWAEAWLAVVLASVTAVVPTFEAPVAAVTDVSPSVACPGNDTTTKEPWRPAANHPWRRLSIGKTHQEQLAC
jgi:hypothetical protein